MFFVGSEGRFSRDLAQINVSMLLPPPPYPPPTHTHTRNSRNKSILYINIIKTQLSMKFKLNTYFNFRFKSPKPVTAKLISAFVFTIRVVLTIPQLSRSKIPASSHLLQFVSDLFGNHIAGFPMTRLKCTSYKNTMNEQMKSCCLNLLQI